MPQMQAALFREPNQPMQIEPVQVADPQPREVLVRTVACGVCHSDYSVFTGKMPTALTPTPTILGHEAAGIVEAVGRDVTYVKKGDHIVTCMSVFCGTCDKCLTGNPALCASDQIRRRPTDEPRLQQNGETIHQFTDLSSFAELMLVHENALTKIDPDMPLDCAALMGCGTTTGVGAVFHTAKVTPGSSVAVIGCGAIGLAAINGAAIVGAGKIIAIDMQPAKLELAKTMGATHCIDPSECDNPVEQVQQITGGGCDYSFEAIGLKHTTEQSVAMLGPGGTATVLGLLPPDAAVEMGFIDFIQEKKIQGCLMGSNRFRIDMTHFVDFYMRGKLHLDPLISKHIRLDQINDAFAAFEQGSADARHVIMFEH